MLHALTSDDSGCLCSPSMMGSYTRQRMVLATVFKFLCLHPFTVTKGDRRHTEGAYEKTQPCNTGSKHQSVRSYCSSSVQVNPIPIRAVLTTRTASSHDTPQAS